MATRHSTSHDSVSGSARTPGQVNLRGMPERASQTTIESCHAAERAAVLSSESTRPAGRTLIVLGVLATLIGLALGLVMSSVGS